MLIDNKRRVGTTPLSVYEFILKYLQQEGVLEIVTGYFSIAGLARFYEDINQFVTEYHLILGEIAKTEQDRDKILNLLNESLGLESGFHLNYISKQAINFIEQEKVTIKTLKPNFCHAKAYLFKDRYDDPQKNFYILGSSNLTEAGLGITSSANMELNSADFGGKSDYKDLSEWFKVIWKTPEAKDNIVINGKSIPFKQYLVELIKNSYKEYTPNELYYKILYELFAKEILDLELNPEFNRQIGHLHNTVVYNTLYPFQKGGVKSLIRMLQIYNGAVLADAVGLGKTWQALAVMKFFEIKGYEVIVICPKKLENNWTKYLMRKNSKFENDRFNYVVRFHTDLQEDRLEKDGIKIRDYFQSDKPKLFVIDESHHLRNDKSARYQFFVEELLRANKDVKVLLLSATPINTKLLDVRNQFKLLVKGNDDGFKETLNINNLTWLFANAQKQLEKWQSVENHNKKISDFITKLPEDFFRLTDSLLVARTRALIKDQHENLFFPEKEPPENIFISPENIGNLKKFDDIFRAMKINLTAYRPYEYTQVKEVTSILEDEKQREKFLVKMMYILLVKRLESSWFSFKNTVETILTHHENALQKVKLFIEKKKEEELALDLGNLEEDFEGNLEDIELDEITLGKKSPIRLLDITDIRKFKAHIEKDIQKLKNLYENLEILAKQISHEKSVNSVDRKLEKLIQIISEKQKKKNKKIVVFSVFKDTIDYLYAELRKRGFKNIAMVSGQESKTDDGYSSKNFEPILERFAPYTKLYNEKEWDWFYSDHEIKDKPDFKTWCRLIRNFEPKTAYCLDNPIEILLATDCLSEGQNLQDCDCVVNYDIHWNPVRIIQRMGRIDRLASPNAKIKGFNFWPAKNYEDFLRLKSRVEIRMALLPLVGAEYEETLTEELQQIVKDNPLISKQTQKMLDQLQTTWDEIDKDDETLGMDDLSLETFRQELLEDFRKHEEKYKNMPNGIYSGFKGKPDIFQMVIPKGLIAMIASPVKPNGVIEHDYTYKHLLYTTPSGNSKYINPKDILSVLRKHKTENRFVPDGIDTGDKAVIETYIKMLKDWLVFMGGSEKGEAGEAAKSAIKGIMQGQPIKTDKIPDRKLSEDYFRPDKFDLICWLAIS